MATAMTVFFPNAREQRDTFVRFGTKIRFIFTFTFHSISGRAGRWRITHTHTKEEDACSNSILVLRSSKTAEEKSTGYRDRFKL